MDRNEYVKYVNDVVDKYLEIPERERSITKLSKEYKIATSTLSKYIKSRGIEVKTTDTKFLFNINVFDNIDTEEKAYWLGFLFADGYISSKRNVVGLALSKKDLAHLEKFKKFLGTENNITEYVHKKYKSTICRLTVANKHFWEQLKEKGCVPNKSNILEFPSIDVFKNKNLVIDFIRGYCDGDGVLGIYNGKHRYFRLNIVGTEHFLRGTQNMIGIKGSINKSSGGKEEADTKCLDYNSTKARKVARILYEHATIYLQRKYDIYKLFCRAEEESSRLKSSKIGEDWNVNTEVSSEIA